MLLQRWREFGLIARLAIVCGAAVALLSVVLAATFVRIAAKQHVVGETERLRSDLGILANAVAGDSLTGDYKGVAEFLEIFARRPGVARVTWADSQSDQVVVSQAPALRTAPERFEQWLDLPAFDASRPVVVGAVTYATVLLHLDPTPTVNEAWELFAATLWWMLLGIGAVGVVMLCIVGHALRPMKQWIGVMVGLGRGDFSVRVQATGPPENAAAMRAFNDMAERVGDLIDSLRASEAKNRLLATIVEQSTDAIMTYDLQGVVMSWNKGAEQTYGWSAQEALGLPLRQLHLRSLTDEQYAAFAAQLRSGERFDLDAQRTTKGGARLHILGSSTPMLDAQGKLLGTIGIARNVTALKQAQQALERANQELEARVHERTLGLSQHEALLRGVMDAMPGVVAFQDGQLNFRVFNRRLSEWLGMDADAIRGKNPAAVTGEEFARYTRPHFENALAGQGVRFEVLHAAADGTLRHVDVSAVPVHTDGGAVCGVASFWMDVTERKQAEQAMRASEARNRVLATMVEQSNDSILARDLDGRVTFWNSGAERLHGFTSEFAVGQPLRSLHMRKLGESELAEVLKRVRSGRPSAIEAQRLTKSGQTIDVAVNTAPLFDATGRHIGEVAVQRDITAAKLAERELRRAKEAAEAANRAKSEFLANMSHEIRTPLNGVLGVTELLLDTELTREQRADLDLVRASGASLMTIINDILDFSKIEAGQLRLEEIEFAPADAIADMVKILSMRAHEKGLELIYDAPGLPRVLVGDPGRLRQIVVNLVGNAIKFTERGEVAVTVSALPDRAEPAAAVTLRVSVRDSGIGIAPEKQGTIFDAFSQADASTTRRYGGTGLGLTISAKLARLMGGTITVESVPGQGSVFTVSVSCGVPAPAPVVALPEPRTLAGRSVLVVQANDTYRKVLVRLLSGWAMVVVDAADTSRAQSMLDQAQRAGRPFELLLLDPRLQGQDGFAWVEQLRGQSQAFGAVVALTSAGQRGDATRCRELGIAAYLVKPVRSSELFDALHAVCEPEPSRVDALDTPSLITRHSLREARRGASILVVDDHETNQLLARRHLEKLGHRVHLANNGQEALDAVARQAFDLVLMDMQMPVMGGLEATVAIRAREAGSAVRVPIIALTANAMQGDRESCLAAGMDDHLTKPYTVQQIGAVLARWLPDGHADLRAAPDAAAPRSAPASAGEPEPQSAPAAVASTCLDLQVLKDYVGDDTATLEKFLRSYLASADKVAHGLRDAYRNRNAETVGNRGHQLKSSARMVGALALGELCAELESAGERQDWAAIDAAMARFESMLTAVAEAADAWLAAHIH